MLPGSLALIDDDAEYTEYLAQFLGERGIKVEVFADSNDLMAHVDPYGYAFYVTDLMLPGIDGANLIKVLRRRTNVGILVVSGKLSSDVFREVVTAGADMYLTKPVQFEQILVAIEAVERRAGAVTESIGMAWVLDRRARQLQAPDGARIDLSDADRIVLECFLEAGGEPVTREVLKERLNKSDAQEDVNVINATIYRLKKRIERATSIAPPLQAKSGIGYLFKGRLSAM